jgi:hypothetical protein
MLGLNEAKVNIRSWTPPTPGSDNGGYVAHARRAVMRGDGHERPASMTMPHEVNRMPVIRSWGGGSVGGIYPDWGILGKRPQLRASDMRQCAGIAPSSGRL